MIVLFLGLMLVNFVCLIGTAVLGYVGLSSGFGSWHRIAGAMAAIVCCGVHCVVFTYFVATGKWIAHAILVKGLEPDIGAPTRPLRRAAVAAALGAITLAIATAIVGEGVDNQYLSGAWHRYLAIGLITGYAVVGSVECDYLR